MAKLALENVPRSLAARDTRGFIKLLKKKDTDYLVGSSILAPEGSELLMEIAMAMQHKIPVSEITAMFHAWPIRLLIGIPLFFISGLVAVNTLLIMKKNKTAICFNKPTTKFIIVGSFRFTRNPLYLSLLLVMGSIVIIANSAWHLIVLVLLFLFFNFGAIVKFFCR